MKNYNRTYNINQDYKGDSDMNRPCVECGSLCNGTYKIGDNYLCCDCFTDTYDYCEECGDVYEKDEMFNESGKVYCETCYNELFFSCYECDSVFYRDDALSDHNGRLYCGDCYHEIFFCCENCNHDYYRDDAYSDGEGYLYCSDCYCELFVCCDDCGRDVYRDDAYCDDDGYYYCEDCENNSNIRRYNYKPFFKAFGKVNEMPLLGLELEIEFKEANRSIIDDIPSNNDWLYFKSDGSLNDGVEIVSMPSSFEYFNEKKEYITNMLKMLSDAGCRSYNTNTCGIHIHISKNKVTHLQLYKMLKLFYENPSFILAISQRKENSFNQWASLRDDDDGNIVLKAKSKNGYNRYTAINLTNRDTIEFRIFRGTLNPNSFYKNIEFIKAVINFSKDSSIKDITVNNFIDYIRKDSKNYINLVKWLEKKNIVSAIG